VFCFESLNTLFLSLIPSQLLVVNCFGTVKVGMRLRAFKTNWLLYYTVQAILQFVQSFAQWGSSRF
jgi:hypothetical protein